MSIIPIPIPIPVGHDDGPPPTPVETVIIIGSFVVGIVAVVVLTRCLFARDDGYWDARYDSWESDTRRGLGRLFYLGGRAKYAREQRILAENAKKRSNA